ncbi:MAG: CARDB domain-containing protein, partial [Anaerolineae bacterium]
FAAYTAQVSPTVNLEPVRIWTDPALPFSNGEAITVTLSAYVVNNGNVATTRSTIVRFYEGHPDQGGVLIGEQSVPPLEGCASGTTVTVTWPDVLPGDYTISAVIDPADGVAESDESDNVRMTRVLIATSRVWLPLAMKTTP